MAFNGSGAFLRVMSWVSDATAGIKIRADRHDLEDDNLAAGLSQCICRDGQSIIVSDIGWNAHRLTNVADPTAPQDAATKHYVDDQVSGHVSFLRRVIYAGTQAVTFHADTTAFLVEVQGGGGGGGNCTTGTVGTAQAASSGGAGGYTSRWIIKPGGVYTPSCTIGPGGGPTAAGSASAFQDGTYTLRGEGGSPGVDGYNAPSGARQGGIGGGASGGDLNRTGDQGGFGSHTIAGAVITAMVLPGASSRFGAGGLGQVQVQSTAIHLNGNTGIGPGSGGSGSLRLHDGAAVVGGAGANGLVVVTEFS